MKIYLSGLNSLSKPVREFVNRAQPRILYSYLHFAGKNVIALKSEWKRWDIFVDSGGYSARTFGIEIPIEKYRDFLVAMRGRYTIAANLDTNSTRESLANQRVLDAANIPVLPVYHYSEYITTTYRPLIFDFCAKYPYIAVGGVAHKNYSPELAVFFDMIFEEAAKRNTKVHGFGITDPKVLEKYPFYSVDSTSWKASDRYGWYFKFEDGKLLSYYGKSKVSLTGKEGNLPHHVRHLATARRMTDSITAFMQMEEFYTELWRRRGVSWE